MSARSDNGTAIGTARRGPSGKYPIGDAAIERCYQNGPGCLQRKWARLNHEAIIRHNISYGNKYL